ncbi:hypothetical protein ILUMI_08888 [Ignelater luminosus]|uniref:PiggyBac transposable element-derived protein domain-containing protein n=1 Tax=Ignelater luminosus TaxID=2038154 RepID=A0A8K0D643_IGNLU|nr:hypothetical protein ILUMI_08888 [Ignelater luminosus]
MHNLSFFGKVILGIFTFSTGLTLLFLKKRILDHVQASILILSPNSPIKNLWIQPPEVAPTDIYFFNWTNPEDFHDLNIKPKLEQHGPYRYMQHIEKKNVVWNNNNTVTFNKMVYWNFDEEHTNGSLSDPITTMNAIVLRITNWLNDIESDFSDQDDIQDSDYYSDHDSASEIENVSDDEVLNDSEEQENENQRGYYGKDLYKWSMKGPAPQRTAAHNIISHLPGVRSPLKELGSNASPYEIWKHILFDEMLQEILIHTNNKLNNIKINYARENKPELGELGFYELKAFIGLLLYTSISKSNHETLESLFATDGSGRDVFRFTMSMKRFLTILAYLRFDDKDSRPQRVQGNRAAAILFIFNQFVKTLKTVTPLAN